MNFNTRSFNISNLNRDTDADINNDVTVTFPDGIFSGKIEAISLKHLYIDFDYEILGSSNNQLIVTYPSTGHPIVVTLDLRTSDIIKTDNQLASLIAYSINNTLGVSVFQVYHNNHVFYSQDVYRDSSRLLSNYTIFTSNNVAFNMNFNLKTSVGPLIGFGNSSYSSAFSYTGGNIPSLGSYESIHIINSAYNSFKLYDQYNDHACKMNLYDASNTLIPNALDSRDTTISLPIVDDYIYSVGEFITLLETELNSYSSSFTPAAKFVLTFDYNSYKFTISNTTGSKFGISFRFNGSGNINNYGSLHKELGFDKKDYLSVQSITSKQASAIFDQCYNNDYILICSDLIKNNFDTSFLVLGSAASYTVYEALFTIPMSEIHDGSYIPIHKDDYRTLINASLFAKKFNEKLPLSKVVNFYLRGSTGRHIKMNSKWNLHINIEFSN